MAKNPAGLEPAEEIGSYSDVPWFRKQWFIIVSLLFFWPAMIAIALTGDIFAKSTKKTRKLSEANVWRYTQGGKNVLVVAGLLFGLVAVLQVLIN